MGQPEEQLPGVPRTAQEQWLDASIRHQIGLLRVSGGIRAKVWRLLDATNRDLRSAIEDRLEHATGLTRPSDVARLRRLSEDIDQIRSTAWSSVRAVWRDELIALALAEPRFMAALLETIVPVQLSVSLPDASRLRAIVTSRPFEGRVLSEWAKDVAAADVRRINDQIQIGLVQNETLPQIVKRVVGTTRLGGADGVIELTRRNAEAITRTAVNAIANHARQELWRENLDVVSRELYVATLDSNTTPACRGFDGNVYPVGEGPIPPVHMRCRSLRTALLDAEAIGERPMKPVTERMLLREFAEREGLDKVTTRAALPRGTRGSFDDFARKRTRELIGRVPAKTSYQQFLQRQSTEFQNDVLGPTRGRLFRAGGLTVQQFTDRAGNELTLAELARRHRDAFVAAGLDPVEFLSR